MKSAIFVEKLLFGFAILLLSLASTAFAAEHRQFSVAQTEQTEAINGQIDWPGGKLDRWTGPVVAFVSSGSPNDRDGWLVRAMETIWADRLPLKDLSSALVSEGVAVIRFDNPGVLQPQLKCRETIFKIGLSVDVLRHRCLDARILGGFTVEKYQRSIEAVLMHVQRIMPAARNRLFLFGFSEGLVHAASIADRGFVRLQGLVSIGSPAESMETVTRWQAIDRMVETLPEFDLNGDGIVSNSEIREGYERGIGNVMGLEGWFSKTGYWTAENRDVLKTDLEAVYVQFRRDTDTGTDAGKLEWKPQKNGVLVPDVTDALWHFHFYDQLASAEVMRRLGIPGLFMWGDKDKQVSVTRQVKLIDQLSQQGSSIRYLRFPGRHHLLSQRRDLDWLEPGFMPVIAKEVRAFLDQCLQTNTGTRPLVAKTSDAGGDRQNVGSYKPVVEPR
ncbi:hypothetical protein RugamoR64_44210 [Duganella rhizosphaerae]|uniref:hypothetical protein n=1 Tax=Duganella rhizosphaerae TaxID=2885763 RepID=UPI0030E8E335